MRSWRFTAFRTVIGLSTLAAIVVQLISAMKMPEFHPANFFGYFTNLSNIFGAFVLLYAGAVFGLSSRGLDFLRGAAALCLAIVGVVFSLLLANLESNVIPWVNIVVHYIMPTAIVLDWLIDPPQTTLTARDGLSWISLPIAYLAYTLARGSLAHWYPYPFLDVDRIGYGSVSTYCAVFLATAVVFALTLVVVANKLRRNAM